ncbi:MAG: 3-isopropylmalate dehydratase [Anaerolineales bacterium]|jgi:3-isopropylmalate/(R)-2-methylmalate dehydratase small subunit
MSTDLISGRVWKYGDDINTDVIFPGKYTYTVSDPRLMPQHALEDLDPSFASQVEPGDVIVAGRNFGCGSSREQAVTCLKESGVGAILAVSFARIYYRNCLNAALPALISSEAYAVLDKGDRVSIDLESGSLQYEDGQISFKPIPASVRMIFDAGGLIEYTRSRLSAEGA